MLQYVKLWHYDNDMIALLHDIVHEWMTEVFGFYMDVIEGNIDIVIVGRRLLRLVIEELSEMQKGFETEKYRHD